MNYLDRPVVSRFLPEREGGTASDERSGRVHETTDSATPLVEVLRRGLPLAEFDSLRGLLGLSEEALAKLVGLSPATLHRRKKADHLQTPESERIVRFARLFGLATEILGSEDAARGWLVAPNPGTAGEAPLSWADTEYGAREVEELLGRIDHGLF